MSLVSKLSLELLVLLLVGVGCARQAEEVRAPEQSPAPVTSPEGSDRLDERPTPGAPPPSERKQEARGPSSIGPGRALALLFQGEPTQSARACVEGEDAQRVRCLIEARYSGDKAARRSALALYDEAGTVAGLEEAHTMNGGYRGMIEIVPHLPVGEQKRHLAWILKANRDFAAFFERLEASAGRPAGYRWQPIEMRFFRSVKRTTPSAYADDWIVAWNVSGSLHRSEHAVRETLFHEIFHLNDEAHGQWSDEALGGIYEAIVARCKDKKGNPLTPCLRPYAPNGTMVKGGTFYAFQPGNDVREYAAELAIRYFMEHRAAFSKRRDSKRPFKCGPPENASAWTLMVDEFFAGVDLIPACP